MLTSHRLLPRLGIDGLYGVFKRHVINVARAPMRYSQIL